MSFINKIGGNGFWFGVVEDRNDPLKIGRCRVRILGYHNELKAIQPTIDLPWAIPLIPINSAAMNGIGHTPLGPVEGTWIMGVFKDGDNCQEPVMMGAIAGIPNEESKEIPSQFGFVNRLPTEIEGKEYNQQLSLKELPRRIDSILLTLDGNGVRFVEAGSQDENGNRVPQGDGYGYLYPRDIFYGFSDISTLATNSNELGNNKPEASSVSIKNTLQHNDVEVAEITDLGGFASIKVPKTLSCVFQQGVAETSTSHDSDCLDFDNLESLAYIKQFTTSILAKNQEGDNWTVETPTGDPIQNELWDEALTQYAAKYPFNHVYETESGHIFEFDDTPAQERINLYHRTGTFMEIHPDGTRVEKTMGDVYDIILRKKYTHIESDEYRTVDKSYKLLVNADRLPDNNMDVLVGEDSNFSVQTEKGNISLLPNEGCFVVGGKNTSFNFITDNGSFVVSVGDSGKILIYGKSVQIETKDDLTAKVGGDLLAEVGNDLCIDAGGNANIKVGANANIDIGGDLTASVAGSGDILVNDTLQIQSNTHIILRAPRIDLNP